jgi:hypothetical protein
MKAFSFKWHKFPGLALFLILLFFSLNDVFTSPVQYDNPYRGQEPPGKDPKIFPLEVQAGTFAAERIAISNDGREILYSEILAYYPLRGDKIRCYRCVNNKWVGPYDLFEGYGPSLSAKGDTLYFERKDLEKNSEIYFSRKTASGWNSPERAMNKVMRGHYFQVTDSHTAYISAKREVGLGYNDWCKVEVNGADTTVVSLGKPLNTAANDLDFFVARDDSYMILTNRPRLAISFKNEDGSWTEPVVFGKKIDFGIASWGPYVSPDNRYLFYTTGTKFDYSDVHVYWVRIDGVIDSLRNIAKGR